MLKEFKEEQVKDRAGVLGFLNRYFKKSIYMWMIKGPTADNFSGLTIPNVMFKYVLKTTRNKIKRDRIRAEYGNFHGRIVVERVKAQTAKNMGQTDPKLEVSLFSEIMRKIKKREERGNKVERFDFEVLFRGEEGIDRGGLLREAMTTVTEELHSFFLPLLVPTANNKNAFGANREKWTINPSSKSPACIAAYEFLGKLMAMCIKSDQIIQLELPSMFWKKLLNMPVRKEDLLQIDAFCLNSLESIVSLPEECFGDFETCYSATLSDGTVVDLIPNGKNIKVPYSKRQEYADMVIQARLNEANMQIEAVKNGFYKLIPQDAYSLFSWEEVEEDICGMHNIDIKALKAMTRYDVIKFSRIL